jgi:hypothetical protein
VIPEGNGYDSPATPIALTADERRDLEALAGSRQSEARMRERARIGLLAAGGIGSRAIGREVGCTPGTASKWRVRYARDRTAGSSSSLEPSCRSGCMTGHTGTDQRVLVLYWPPYDMPASAHERVAIERILFGAAMSAFQASQQASTIPV